MRPHTAPNSNLERTRTKLSIAANVGWACFFLVCTPLSAQAFIVPARLTDLPQTSTAVAPGNAFDFQSFFYNAQPVRVQHLWDVTDIAVSDANLTAMSFRRPNAISDFLPTATANLFVLMSVGSNTVSGRSTTFDANHGAIATMVFSGNVALPQSSRGTGPAPFVVTIPFAHPFTYARAAGMSLVADVNINAYTPAPGTNPFWYVDAVGTDSSGASINGPRGTCTFSNGSAALPASYSPPVLRGNWFVNYQGDTARLPSGLAATGLLGLTGAGGMWQGITLPFPLPGVPTCLISTSILITAPLGENTAAGVYDWPLVPLPDDPTVYNLIFFDQGLFFDAGANPLGIVTTTSSQWTIRSGNVPRGAKIWQYTSGGIRFPSSTRGFSEPVATIVEFSY